MVDVGTQQFAAFLFPFLSFQQQVGVKIFVGLYIGMQYIKGRIQEYITMTLLLPQTNQKSCVATLTLVLRLFCKSTGHSRPQERS
jgi:hypothetical protein